MKRAVASTLITLISLGFAYDRLLQAKYPILPSPIDLSNRSQFLPVDVGEAWKAPISLNQLRSHAKPLDDDVSTFVRAFWDSKPLVLEALIWRVISAAGLTPPELERRQLKTMDPSDGFQPGEGVLNKLVGGIR